VPDYRRARLTGGTFFFTVVTYRRYPIFGDDAAAGLLDGCLKEVTARLPCDTDAIVILPDHIHAIWTLPEGDFDFSTRWKRIKAAFTRRYSGPRAGIVAESMLRKGEGGVWQRRFWEHRIRDQEDFNRHCDYIHYNPVKHGLVDLPIEWKHSSFGQFVERGVYPEGWGQSAHPELIAMDLG